MKLHVEKQYEGQNAHTLHGSNHLHVLRLFSHTCTEQVKSKGGWFVNLSQIIHKWTTPYCIMHNICSLHYSCINPSFYPALFLDELISLPLPVVWVTLTTQENLLTGSSCPSGLIGPQHPVRRDQYIIPSVTSPCSLAASSFPASLYFHFIIISHSGSMQANRPTVNHTTIRAVSNLLVDSISFTTASK